MATIQMWDNMVVQFFQGHMHSPVLNFIMTAFTYLGEAGAIWIGFTLLFLIMKKTRKVGYQTTIALLLCVVLSNVLLKSLVARDRPFEADPALMLLISPPGGYSFPSGHSVSSFAAASVIFAWNKKWGAGALILAALIGFSRVYLCVHYMSDVVCGIVVGCIIGFATAFVFRKADQAIQKKCAANQTAQTAE